MKIFETDYKVNFVDDANVLVGFDNDQKCYERFGYFLSRNIPSEIEADEIDPEGFNFDTAFFRQIGPDETSFCDDCGGLVTFRLTKGTEEIFLTLYNSHNGYYSHGFEMTVGGTKIHHCAI
jgi:hypothetical protein